MVGAGADDLILLIAQTFLGPGRRAAIDPPTYALYAIATTLHGAEVVGSEDEADLRWVCNPENPTELGRARGDRGARPGAGADGRRRGRGVRRVRRAPARAVDELPNLVVIRTLSKAFGLAALRVATRWPILRPRGC